MFKEDLIKSGLKEKEALIYGILIASHSLPVNEIIKKTKLKRGIVYKILYDLEEKGLVKEVTQKKKLHFSAEHPFILADIVESKLKEAQKNQLSLNSVLPLLISTFKSNENKPGVRIYEGVEGVKEVYLDTLKTDHTVLAMVDTNIIKGEIHDWLFNYYISERVKRKIRENIIVNADNKDYINKNEQELRETRGISSKDFKIGIELNIYGGKVAFIHFGEKEGELFAIVIENQFIYDTLKTMFTLAWNSVKP